MKETLISSKKSGAKRSKVESNREEKNTLKRKLAASSDSEYDVKEDVLDTMPSSSKKIEGMEILVNVHVVPLDNTSFHTEGNVQNPKP